MAYFVLESLERTVGDWRISVRECKCPVEEWTGIIVASNAVRGLEA